MAGILPKAQVLDFQVVPKTKISVVKYLNSIPLAWGILEGPQAAQFEPVLHTPAECADQLKEGKVDIGLIPSIEFQRIKGSKIIPGLAVACRHRVRSVLLISVKPLYQVKTVAVDNTSRTSAALARIVFDEFYHITPDFRPAAPDLTSMLAQSDAAVLIGDPALQFMQENELPNEIRQKAFLKYGPEPLEVFDLAERWKFLTGLPFTFAFWAAREGFKDQGVADALRASREYGLQHIPDIAKRYAESLSLKEEFLREYLTENVDYHMDDACVEGLRVFYEMAARVGAIKSARSVEFL
jgi:chorismate dehydratase